jgi:hypothetical protein
MHGLGDNIYQRAFLPRDRVAYLTTPWPELIADLPNIRPVRTKTRLRTQQKNELASTVQWYSAPPGRNCRFRYAGGNILAEMMRSTGLQFHDMTLPDFGPRPIQGKYAIVRPATLRKEWYAAARNPLVEYIDLAARAAMAAGYHVISVADVDGAAEWFDGTPPACDAALHRGELHLTELLRYTQHADLIIGGPGWIVPAAMAQKRNALIIYGGEGGWNAPEILTHPMAGEQKITHITPDNFCRCRNHKHDCDKRIENAAGRIRAFFDVLA